jgi:hypothetical protein
MDVDVRLLYFDDCPNWRVAEARLNEAVAGIGNDDVVVSHELVSTPEEAEQAGFRGSPTILVNGVDPFAGPEDPIGFACRLYDGAAGVDHAPTLDQLRSALGVAR